MLWTFQKQIGSSINMHIPPDKEIWLENSGMTTAIEESTWELILIPEQRQYTSNCRRTEGGRRKAKFQVNLGYTAKFKASLNNFASVSNKNAQWLVICLAHARPCVQSLVWERNRESDKETVSWSQVCILHPFKGIRYWLNWSAATPNKWGWLGMVVHANNPTRPRWEYLDCQCQANLGYIWVLS